MSENQKSIVETMKKREQDIEIMQLLLKHNLTKKRAEYTFNYVLQGLQHDFESQADDDRK